MKGAEVFENISEDACRALEGVVGPEYITTDPIYCMSYTGHGYGREIFWYQGVSQTPAGIVLPENTDQVARVVRVCNRFGIAFTPMSTHCFSLVGPMFSSANHILIDLRRMNRMWIDDKNMYAIVEPAVIYAEMQGAILQRDLCSVNPGGGGVASVVANHFVQGQGIFNYRITPYSGRRMNGLEWVTPEGEIYRFGALIEGDDHGYWQDGLGPNAEGLLKGYVAWTGGMGIVTKVATKLYPFQPQELEPDGLGPNTCVRFPPRVRYYNITFPTLEALEKAMAEISKAEIGTAVNKVPTYWRGIAKARGDRDFRNSFWDEWDKVTPEIAANTHILRVLLVGRASQSQLDYEEQVLMDILNENEGTPRKTPQNDEATFQYANTPDMWMPTGQFGATTVGHGSNAACMKGDEMFRDRLAASPMKGAFLDQKGELPWYCPFALGRIRYSEHHAFIDAMKTDPEGAGFDPDYTGYTLMWTENEGPTINLQTGFYGPTEGLLHPYRTIGPARHNPHIWSDRFKQEFDPKGLSAPPWPYVIDMVLDGAPVPMIGEELQEVIKKAAAGPWMGNPE